VAGLPEPEVPFPNDQLYVAVGELEPVAVKTKAPLGVDVKVKAAEHCACNNTDQDVRRRVSRSNFDFIWGNFFYRYE